MPTAEGMGEHSRDTETHMPGRKRDGPKCACRSCCCWNDGVGSSPSEFAKILQCYAGREFAVKSLNIMLHIVALESDSIRDAVV